MLSDALAEGLSSPTLNMCLLECYVELEQYAEAGALLSRLEQSESPELLSRARQMLLDTGVTLTPSVKNETDSSQDEMATESEENSVLSEFSFSTDPTFDLQDESLPEVEMSEVERDVFAAQDVIDHDDDIDELQPGEPPLDDAISEVISSDQHVESFAKSELAPAEPTEASEEEQGLQLRPLETDDLGAMKEVKAEFSDAVDSQSDDSDRPYTSGLSLEPMEADADLSADNSAQSGGTDESIYGAETDPIYSKLDLARAYIDMGDEDGARPVLMDVIKEGNLGQQAEARELLLSLEASGHIEVL